jgi:hypothetical protein
LGDCLYPKLAASISLPAIHYNHSILTSIGPPPQDTKSQPLTLRIDRALLSKAAIKKDIKSRNFRDIRELLNATPRRRISKVPMANAKRF